MNGKFVDELLSRLSARVATRIIDRLEEGLLSELENHLHQEILSQSEQRIQQLTAAQVKASLESVPAIAERFIAEYLSKNLMTMVDKAFTEKTLVSNVERSHPYTPNDIVSGSISGEYMRASNALARDFLHPDFKAFCDLYDHPIIMHRKLWEFAYIYCRLSRAGVLRAGMRGLGFGVGGEKLPSLFASAGVKITATDAPTDTEGWRQAGQYAGSSEDLYFPAIISREQFDQLVSYEGCDMNHISDSLTDYDFCWSSCALEHLGGLQNGIDFVVNSVEKTLKVGGIACHTTELNLSSDVDTLETAHDVIYRRCDLERLIEILKDRGHWVEPLRVEPGDLPPDYLVDLPPYSGRPHLKLLWGSFVTTSVGITVRRGR